jgi:hypothetical protein
VLTDRIRLAIRTTCVDPAGGYGILAGLVDDAASAGAAAALTTDSKRFGIVGICQVVGEAFLTNGKSARRSRQLGKERATNDRGGRQRQPREEGLER